MSNMFASLRFGSGGDLVNELQQRLNEKGYDVGVVDGEFGKRTLGGVLKFQEDQFGNYADDGIVGSMTAAALGMHLPHLSEI
ncbi:MAG: peptidoglycan-binding protein [Rhodospirillaceae bacterium]|nr:peptidoglycan-binding protein [Rhodospirillaceae bacterium]